MFHGLGVLQYYEMAFVLGYEAAEAEMDPAAGTLSH